MKKLNKYLFVVLLLASFGCAEQSHAFGWARAGSGSQPKPTSTPTPVATATPVSSSTPSPTATPTASATPVVATATALYDIYDEVISVFENSTTTLDYSYVQDIGDGRGYTCGRAGFTTADGDLLEVVQLYLQTNPNSAFKNILPTLVADANSGTSSISGLSTLPAIWAAAANDPVFRADQDTISNELYYDPAVSFAATMNIQSPIGLLCIYDASIQQGMDGTDGVYDMVSKMPARDTYATEYDWIAAFNAERIYTLDHASDPSTAEGWEQSTVRVTALQNILSSGNYDLANAFSIDPYGDTFLIHGTNN